MKWIKVVYHFVIRHLPRWLHIAAHEVAKVHEDCPDCDVHTDPCDGCPLYEDCNFYDEQLKGGD